MSQCAGSHSISSWFPDLDSANSHRKPAALAYMLLHRSECAGMQQFPGWGCSPEPPCGNTAGAEARPVIPSVERRNFPAHKIDYPVGLLSSVPFTTAKYEPYGLAAGIVELMAYSHRSNYIIMSHNSAHKRTQRADPDTAPH